MTTTPNTAEQARREAEWTYFLHRTNPTRVVAGELFDTAQERYVQMVGQDEADTYYHEMAARHDAAEAGL